MTKAQIIEKLEAIQSDINEAIDIALESGCSTEDYDDALASVDNAIECL